ncbi:hypothetical protein SLS56_012057 [Neofusicoccum ribis]|uniref:Uncharacterized protein n=1 Tax=Neofusicoccum ribis TaxID=45134 RepID=A0ABR3S9X9_9PEZI
MTPLRLLSSTLVTLLFAHQATTALLDVDWASTKCAHFHRDNGYLRYNKAHAKIYPSMLMDFDANRLALASAEYHALQNKTEAGNTYFIDSEFAMGEILDGMAVWQGKEYDVAKVSGANILLAMVLEKNSLQLLFQPDVNSKLQVQWETSVKAFEVYRVGIEILAKANDGHVRLWWYGKPVRFTSTNTTMVVGNMFPVRAKPKFGTYQGKGIDVDTFVYQIQISNEKSELDGKFF